MERDARLLQFGRQRCRRLRPAIDHRGDRTAGLHDIVRRPVSRIVVGEEHGALARQRPIVVEVALRRPGQHDSGAVVVGEDQGPFVGAAGEHHPPRLDVPQALAGDTGRRARPQMVGAALQRAQRVVVVVAEERGAGEHAHLGHGGQALCRRPGPGCAVSAVDTVTEAEQRAAERCLLVHEQDPRAGLAGGERGGDPGRAAAHHEHVAVCGHLVVGVGIGRLGRVTEAGHAPDGGLVERLPERCRPEEGLVVKAGGEERREPPGPGGEVEVGARPGVDARGCETVVELHLGRAQVGLGARANAQLDQRGRLLRAGGEDAARAVIFEAPAGEVRAVRDQRGRQCVAGVALIAAPVEGEAEALRPVDPPALLETKAHYSSSASPPDASGPDGLAVPMG